jgi:hypothetical protein
MILNHADWMFYVSGAVVNGAAGLQNLMDTVPITLWGDNTPMYVTPEGAEIAPTLQDYVTDRALRFGELTGEWFVEAALARDAYAPRADPVIARDGNRGRVALVYQAAAQDDPKGAVAAEIIAWLMTQIPEVEPVTDIYVLMGNVNTDSKVDIADAIALLGYLFGGGLKPPPVCAKAADANDDDRLDIADAIKILGYLFNRQPMLAPDHSLITAAGNTCTPYPAGGNDGTPFFPAAVGALPPCQTQCR